MQRDVDVSRFLAEQGAPATRPTLRLPPGPYRHQGHVLSYWTFASSGRDDVAPDSMAALRALRECHAALKGFSGPLPDFREKLEETFATLRRRRTKAFLSKVDFQFLVSAQGALWKALKPLQAPEQALHGDAHLGNTLRTGKGVLWTDFESACRGPVEWDLSCLPAAAVRARADKPLLRLLRNWRSWCVAVWCWNAYDLSEEKREAAAFHLARLRKTLHRPKA